MITRDAADEATAVDDVDPMTGCFVAEALSSIGPGSSVAKLEVTDFWEFDQAIGEQVLRAIGPGCETGSRPFACTEAIWALTTRTRS